MKVKIKANNVKGIIYPPTSKSDAHRALICAALAFNQKSIIHNIYINDDILATLNAIKELGADYHIENNTITIKGLTSKSKEKRTFYAKESGSTLRFLIPLFSYFSSSCIVSGEKSLMKRPLSIYQEILKDNLQKVDDTSYLIKDSFKAGDYIIKGNISSQFISGLLFLLPLLQNDSTIKVLPPFESKSYILMSIKTLKQFNIDIDLKDDVIYIKGNQQYKSCEYVVEADYSQAAFFAVLGLLKGEITLKNLKIDSLQGDKAFVNILKKMNGNINYCKNDLICKPSLLKGTEIDLANCPDLGPILMVAAALAEGKTHFINAKRLRIKESDRIASMEEELKKFNIDISTTEDEVFIVGNKNIKNVNCDINSHHDHRIAMSLAILASSLSESEIIINDAMCVEKSYPTFYEDLLSINGKVEYIND